MSSYARAGEGAAVKLATDAAAAATAEDKKERRENAGVSATEWREGGGWGGAQQSTDSADDPHGQGHATGEGTARSRRVDRP